MSTGAPNLQITVTMSAAGHGVPILDVVFQPQPEP